MSDANLRIFEFDYDLTWVAFFLSPDEQVLGRFGGRDASGPDGRLSLDGLRHAMERALKADPPRGNSKLPTEPLRADDLPAARRHRGQCIHCHQVGEFLRDDAKSRGQWTRDDVWVYPLPENVGITLDVDQGDRVKAVKKSSTAERLGLLPNDVIRKINDVPIASFADVQYALHKSPKSGSIPIVWERDGKELTGTLELIDGWRKTNLTWRPSMFDLLPSLSLAGEDLTAAEKKSLGLAEGQLAFRQRPKVHSAMKAAGIQGGDIIIGLNDQKFEVSMSEFLGHVRRNFLVGDRIALDIIRDGKRLAIPITLK